MLEKLLSPLARRAALALLLPMGACDSAGPLAKSQSLPTQPQHQFDAEIRIDPVSADQSLLVSCEAYNPKLDEPAIGWTFTFDGQKVERRDGFRTMPGSASQNPIPNNDNHHIFDSSGKKLVECLADFSDGSQAYGHTTVEINYQEAPRFIFSQTPEGEASIKVDPVNISFGSATAAFTVQDVPYRDHSGQIRLGGWTARASRPEATINLSNFPGVWELTMNVSYTYAGHIKLAGATLDPGGPNQRSGSYRDYISEVPVDSIAISERTKVPVYAGPHHFRHSDVAYVSDGTPNATGSWDFSIVVPE